MKNTIKAILLSLVAAVSAVRAGESQLPVSAPAESTLKANVFAASLLNEDADASYGAGVSLETLSVHNVSLRASLVSLENESLTLGTSALFTIPVAQAFSVYAVGGVDYELDKEFWSASLGGGATMALTQRVNLFVETSYGFAIDRELEDKGWGVSAGVGVKF
jgi:hypothetical protein